MLMIVERGTLESELEGEIHRIRTFFVEDSRDRWGKETAEQESDKKKRREEKQTFKDKTQTDRLRVCLRSPITRRCVRKHTLGPRLHHERRAAKNLLHELQVDASN